MIKIPAEIIVSVAWGGQNLDQLYVGTAAKAFDINSGAILNQTFSAGSGSIYVVTGLNATGPAGRPVCL